MDYRHTQHRPITFDLAIAMLLILVVVIAGLAGSAAGMVIGTLTGIFVMAALYVFGRFTVEVSETGIRGSFGWGWPARAVSWTDVSAARRVENRWWYGWGIRWFPGGTLWNVWGLDGIELDVTSGRRVRFGTDQPDALLAAVRAAAGI